MHQALRDLVDRRVVTGGEAGVGGGAHSRKSRSRLGSDGTRRRPRPRSAAARGSPARARSGGAQEVLGSRARVDDVLAVVDDDRLAARQCAASASPSAGPGWGRRRPGRSPGPSAPSGRAGGSTNQMPSGKRLDPPSVSIARRVLPQPPGPIA
jgi:hypothetical protein